MNDDRAIELGRIVAAWEHFRWLPGMLDDDGSRIMAGLDEEMEPVVGYPYGTACGLYVRKNPGSAVPNLRDLPTQAAVLQLIEEQVGGATTLDGCIGHRKGRDVIDWAVLAIGVIWNGPRRASRAEAIAAAVQELSNG